METNLIELVEQFLLDHVLVLFDVGREGAELSDLLGALLLLLKQQRPLVEQALHALGLGLDLARVTALRVLHLLDLLLHLVAHRVLLLDLILDFCATAESARERVAVVCGKRLG